MTAYARRYPKSELLDSYWYILAYCDFATGKHASAIDMCRKVAQAQHLDKQSGRMVDSPNKYRAIYILGQIYQSLGQRGDAIREYRRVEDRIPDAKSSVGYFLRKQIALPDCTTLKPGAAAEVELSFRNIAACDVKVYRVDLMKFCEAGQALGDLSQVNLAGIRPLHEASVALGDGKDYCDHVQKLALPLKKEGAYLVVCRGEDLYASGLLLISPLEIESRFDPPAGQVRVFVKDATTGKYLSDVQVKLMPRPAAGQAERDRSDRPPRGLRGQLPGDRGDDRGPGRQRALCLLCQPAAGQRHPRGDRRHGTAGRRSDGALRAGGFEPLRADQRTRWRRRLGGQRRHGDAELPTNLSLRLASQEVTGIAARAAAPRRRLPCRNVPCRRRVPTRRPCFRGDESRPNGRSARRSMQPTQFEFVETPLKDVVDYLKDLHHIEIQLDSPALKEAGVDESTPVTKNLKGISLRSALKLMLDELQLKYVIHNDVLLITSPDQGRKRRVHGDARPIR